MKLSNLTDTQYLIYYFRRTKGSIDDYEAFINNLSHIIDADDMAFIDKVHQLHYINITPYLYTIHTNTSRAFKSFLVYVYHYLKKSEYNSKDVDAVYESNQIITCCNVQTFLNLLKYSNLMMVSILFLMQYYFL
jgi:hypothetical protein